MGQRQNLELLIYGEGTMIFPPLSMLTVIDKHFLLLQRFSFVEILQMEMWAFSLNSQWYDDN